MFECPQSIITTIAGTGVASCYYCFSNGDGGAATSAHLHGPRGLALDASGNLFIADTGNNRIRMVTINGTSRAVYVLGTAGVSNWGAVGGNQNAKWIWMSALAATSSYDDVYTPYTFSGSFVSTTSYTGTIEVFVDDLATVFVNGQMIQSINYFTWSAWYNDAGKSPQQASISVVTGTNNIVVIALNTGGSAGLLLSIKDNNGNYVYTTDSSWTFQRISGSLSTFSGTGTAGSSGDGGAATSAQLNGTSGISVDVSGNVYIADSGNNKIRKVNSAGIITTFAGTGAQGSSGDSGAGTSAQLSGPTGVSVDISRNAYIADSGNNKIRKVTSTGIITTIAGTGTVGSSGDGGRATSAQLSNPTGVSVDISGNMYIADCDNNKIRMVTGTGIINTIAGTGTSGSSGDGGAATSAQLNHPNGVSVDVSGNVYIVDDGNNKIRMVTSTGIIITIAGTGAWGSSGDGGAATSAQLSNPQGIALDQSGGFYIADSQNNKIRYSSTSLKSYSYGPTRTLGFDRGTSCAANCVYGSFYGPGVAYDADFSNVQPVGNQGWMIGAGTFQILCPSCSMYTDATYGPPHFGGIKQPGFLQKVQSSPSPWSGTISLTFNGVTVGNRYFVGFWQQNRNPDGFLASWIVSLGGSAVYRTVPHNSPQYINTTSVLATSSQLTVTFSATSDASDWRSVWLGGATLYQSNDVPLPPAVSPNKYYLAVAMGLSAYYVAQTQPASVCCGSGLYNATTGAWLEGAGRSYTVVRLSSSTGAIVSKTTYDVYGQGGWDLANDLNGYGSESVVVIYTYDEPYTYRWSSGMDTAMYRCGASASMFVSSDFQYRSAYILVGICGRGAGSGFEAYAGSVSDDLNAMVAVAFQITKSGFVASSSPCPENMGSITGYSPCTVRPKGFYISAPVPTPPLPTSQPSTQPSRQPSVQPTRQPNQRPSVRPSRHPSMQPSRQPINRPSNQPSRQPSQQPSVRPTSIPSREPCSPGTYSTNPGAFVGVALLSRKCLIDSCFTPSIPFYELGFSECLPCASGSFSSSSGLSSCTLCSGGFYASSIGSSSCSLCSGSGSYSAAGASVCSQCLAGSIPANGGSSCSQCAGMLQCPAVRKMSLLINSPSNPTLN